MVESAAASAQGQNAHHLIVAVQSSAHISCAGSLGNGTRGSGHASAHHALQCAVRIGHGSSVAGVAVHNWGADHPLIHDQNVGGHSRTTPTGVPALDTIGNWLIVEHSRLNVIRGEGNNLSQTQDGQVVVVGVGHEAVMRIHVTDGAHKPSGRRNKQVVVSANDTDPSGMCQSGSIHHTGGGGQDVTVVDNHAIAVDTEWGINGA